MKCINFLTDRSKWNDLNLFKVFKRDAKGFSEDVRTLKDVRQKIISLFKLDRELLLTNNEIDLMNQEIERARCIIKSDFPDYNKSVYIFGMSELREAVMKEAKGVSGFAYENAPIIYLHPNGNFEQKLARTLLHEINHTIRFPHGDPYKTFLDYLLLEGYAEVYVSEKFPNDPPSPWTHSATFEELAKHRPTIEKFWLNESLPLDYRDWMFGSKRRNIPRWIGYTLGYSIVSQHREIYKSLDWDEYIKIPSIEIIDTLKSQPS